MRVLICGGGVIGVSIAYFLARRGVKVTVIERSGLACAASGKSGGFLAADWCDGTPLAALARRSFALHAKLAATLDADWGYRRLATYGGFAGGSGRGASYPAPPPQIPACGFPAPGSCRESSAIDVRGLGGPFSFDPPVGASYDTPRPALCPGRASASTISPGRVPSLHALRRRSSRPCSSPSTVLWTRPTPPAFLTGYAHSSFPARPGVLRLRATGGLPGSDAFLSGVMWSPTPAE